MTKGIDAVRDATKGLHARAERGGVVADILAGRATRRGVALLLRNLLPVYRIIDSSPFGVASLARSAAIEADLLVLAPGVELPLLPEGAAYAEQVARAATGNGVGLIAHAYVRYLGDLNGGRVIQRRLMSCLGEMASRLVFHTYPMLKDEKAFAAEYRNQLDTAAHVAGVGSVIQEAMIAFDMNIALSQSVGLSDQCDCHNKQRSAELDGA